MVRLRMPLPLLPHLHLLLKRHPSGPAGMCHRPRVQVVEVVAGANVSVNATARAEAHPLVAWAWRSAPSLDGAAIVVSRRRLGRVAVDGARPIYVATALLPLLRVIRGHRRLRQVRVMGNTDLVLSVGRRISLGLVVWMKCEVG